MNNTNFIIDKSTWKPVKFGDVVIEPKEVCKDIYTEGIEHVVGLEHIETGDIHLRKSETTEESTTFSKKFHKGDVLFGRRRAYLKKAALAHFEGICSGDITVFRSKEELLPQLLPFIVNNDKFFDYAVKHSAGGLSPRVKFKDLAKYNFLLPSKAEQARLAELLWAIDDVIQKEKATYEKNLILKTCFIKELNINASSFINLDELFEINWGNTNITKKSYIEKGYLAYSASGSDGFLNDFEFDTNGIVLSAIGAECGKCFLATGKWTAIKNTITLIPKKINFNYLKIIFELINNKNFWPSNGGAQPFISQADARKTKVPLLEVSEVDRCYEILNSIISNIENSKMKLESSMFLQKSIINQFF